MNTKQRKNTKKTFIFGGDFCLDKIDYKISEDLIDVFKNSDGSIFNLEAPIIYAKDTKNYTKYPKAGPNIYQNENIIYLLKKINTKYLSGANNHIMDYGKLGILSTKKILDENNIKYSGFGNDKDEAQKIVDLNENIVIINICEEEFGIAEKNTAGTYSMYDKNVNKQIKDQKNKNKFVIIYAHGGGELIPLPSKYILDRYREFVDLGADIVIGHHPHVPQGYEKYKKKYIFYSLGNFIHSSFNNYWGILLKLDIFEDSKTIYEIIPISINEKEIKIIKEKEKYFNYINKINKIINNSLFEAMHQEQAIDMYKCYYQEYFKNILTIAKRDILKDLFFNFLLKKKKNLLSPRKENNDELLLLHLIRNNSHKEFIETALKIKTKEIEDARNTESNKIYSQLQKIIKLIQY